LLRTKAPKESVDTILFVALAGKSVVSPPALASPIDPAGASPLVEVFALSQNEITSLRRRLRDTLLVDRRRLQRDLDRLAAQTELSATAIATLSSAIDAASVRRARRVALRPPITLDEALPITHKADDIVALIRQHPVVVIAGETGSGKTTQIPKLCLAADRGVDGMIGCTQPRRIAARSVARRVAAELGSELGRTVGFQVRFAEQVGDDALIKFMTDGILLAETQSDPWLNAYDTIILDEAHERSLNIDFLLGYLKRLLSKRRDLKLIVTSATIDTARFAAHFDGAPVVEIEGRGFPVELRYRPPDADAEGGLIEHIVAAVDEVTAHDGLGDVLIFLAGEREIRDLHLSLSRRKYRETEVLPLYARLSSADQDRVFRPGPKRRIVLATNVAETSLTVPRIRYVIDPGTARVKRYSPRSQLERLHIEPISQAAADQRKGRCGRVAAGICVRLFSEDDYAARPRYSDPEILRSSLAGVILRMLALNLGEVEKFPFVEAPPDRAIGDGYRKLTEIGALDERKRLTPIGRLVARLPVDVALGRMLVEAQSHSALREMLVLTAFLSIADPRERPAELRQQADQAHAAFADKQSDFVGIMNLWTAYTVAHEDLTQSKLRDWCQARFLSFMRMREWRELHRQLWLIAQEIGWEQNAEAASYEIVHRCLISGWPSQVARRDERGQYVGTRQRRYQIFPGSALAKHGPAWLLSGQIIDLQRVYAMSNARIEPAWIEAQTEHLIKRTYRDPHWSRKQGAVMAFEQVTLFGLTLVERRSVRFADQDPALAREIFIREGLVRCEVDCRAGFVRANARVLELAHEREAQQRRQGLLLGEDQLCAFFETKLPADVSTSAGLDAWFRRASAGEQAALHWSIDDVISLVGATEEDFPPTMMVAGSDLRLEYRFVPNDPADGVTLNLPLALLNALDAASIGWLVPGMLVEKVSALIRALPKSLRRNFVPAPDFARAFVQARAGDCSGDLPIALAEFLARTTGAPIAAEAFVASELDAHLQMNLRVLDESGQPLAMGRDLAALQNEFSARARAAFSRRTDAELTRENVNEFDFDEIAEVVTAAGGLQAFPALTDLGQSVALRVFETAQEAAREHRFGVARLLRRALADKIKQARRQLPLSASLSLKFAPLGSIEGLREDIVEAALRACLDAADLNLRRRERFEQGKNELARELFPAAIRRLQLAEAVISAHAELLPWLDPPLLGFARANYDDLREQLNALFFPGFMREVDNERMEHYPRYLRAMRLRAERLRLDPARDQARMLGIQPYWRAYLALAASQGSADAELSAFRWQIEELRVAQFAQELRTPGPVSPKRLQQALDALQRPRNPGSI
jgi:ATP-dependent helicase HrpA